jgi:hypothetical protein
VRKKFRSTKKEYRKQKCVVKMSERQRRRHCGRSRRRKNERREEYGERNTKRRNDKREIESIRRVYIYIYIYI